MSDRYNPIGELYSYDKINSLMHQAQVKDIGDMPAAIDKFEREGPIQRANWVGISGDVEDAHIAPDGATRSSSGGRDPVPHLRC